ncbi:unnamed protein product [Blepharisma stoltei]|uniref:Uncharacterized protein n=1 Tax=Blepharisma stoltei TaxID=1481888 RepID=A0AAU9I676_9CILI|nr:unnamed protein product [Blepharisma stoltei]
MDSNFLRRFRGRYNTVNANSILESSIPIDKRIKSNQVHAGSPGYKRTETSKLHYDDSPISKPRTRSSDHSNKSRKCQYSENKLINCLNLKESVTTSKSYPAWSDLRQSMFNSTRGPTNFDFVRELTTVSDSTYVNVAPGPKGFLAYDNTNVIKARNKTPLKSSRFAANGNLTNIAFNCQVNY